MSSLRTPFAAATLLAALGLVSSCAVGPGYGDGGYVGVGYSGGYYDPCCYSGNWGWGGHYHVGPPAGGGRPDYGHSPGGGGHPPPGGPEHGGGGHSGGGGGHGGGAPSIPGHPR
jgi:hypothetical protein